VVDREVSRRKVATLRNYLMRLAAFRGFPESEFVANPDVHVLAERYLHLAMECVLDLAAQIVRAEGLSTPSTNAETFDILARAGLLSPELATRLRQWAKFRNVLVHLYLDIDHNVSYRSICHELEDLEAFADLIERRVQ